ncbi:beta-lactamase domain containing protein [Janthinobacterium sp. HH01]|uniref:MBL fold metallo-hydrolase n=1 Tax=Janthinobacterium sp. HH01 TaxID=1198452 RepID=UPI0002AEBB64|nr:MBL fold metallo-hydrolase [Janthinobacterium sp. HH01]ELX09319.1 beta-lactamase domain containing protein [Janthinobacterium sp. HH01]
MNIRKISSHITLACTLAITAGMLFAAAKDLSAEKIVRPEALIEVSPGVYVIEDKEHVFLVPNVTIISGQDAVLVVDTGLGTKSAQLVLETAKRIANGRKIYLTITHFHPEHGFGAQVFKGQATIIYNRAQRDELFKKGPAFRTLFSEKLGVTQAMKDVRLVAPDVVYENEAYIDLGERIVKLNYYQAAHTLGDQVVSIPAQGVVILGDLLETRSFPIMPWFPELEDTDVDPLNWREIFRKVAATNPRIVIPGHGPIGNADDLAAAASHMDIARAEVAQRCATGTPLAQIQKELVPVLSAQHSDWDLKDWIGMEIQVYHERLCRK